MATTEIPIYRYTIDLNWRDDETAPAHRQVDAMQYQIDGDWLVFDSPEGTVLTIRHELVLAVQRGEQVNKREVEKL